MPYGEYAGWPLSQLSDEYLRSVLSHAHAGSGIRGKVVAELSRRGATTPQVNGDTTLPNLAAPCPDGFNAVTALMLIQRGKAELLKEGDADAEYLASVNATSDWLSTIFSALLV